MPFVPERLRGRGIGTSLVRRAEEEAWRRRCSGVAVANEQNLIWSRSRCACPDL
ncbi:MAG: GNAT family N-acetyltransferase [Acetobacteraceae bacterium]